MGDPGPRSPVAVLSSTWGDTTTEAAFVARGLAGAISRHRPVNVLVVGRPGSSRPDGAFDLTAVGQARVGGWPVSKKMAWPASVPTVALIEAGDTGAFGIATRSAPNAAVAVIANGSVVPDGITAVFAVAAGDREALLASGVPESHVHDVGLHVPINPIAAKHRHNGLGFTDYLLVLSDRDAGSAKPGDDPTPLAAWLLARYPREHVVVIEDAVAAIWQFRSLRGMVTVDTRTDLWRLMAHARALVDLRPGRRLARECVESLRFGTPVVTPAGSIGATLAEGGGGLWFRDEAELLGCVERLADPVTRDILGSQGRRMADARYGNPDAFVTRVGDALTSIEATR